MKLDILFPPAAIQEEAKNSFSWLPLWNHRRASFLFTLCMGPLSYWSIVDTAIQPAVEAALFVVCGTLMLAGKPSAYILGIALWGMRWVFVSAVPAILVMGDALFSISTWIRAIVALLVLVVPSIWLLGGHQVETVRNRIKNSIG